MAAEILAHGRLAFDPAVPDSGTAVADLHRFLDNLGTQKAVPILSELTRPATATRMNVEPWLRQSLMEVLQAWPIRPRGVYETIELIISRHPSNATNVGKESGISHRAMEDASLLLRIPPESLGADAWFRGIGTQLLDLLAGSEGDAMKRVASYIIGFGVLGREKYGAPGMPGWKVFAESILRRIDPTLGGASPGMPDDTPIFVSSAVNHPLMTAKILWRHEDVASALIQLVNLVTLHPNPSLTRRLLHRVLLPLWSISSWSGADEARYRAPAQRLLRVLVQLTSGNKPRGKPDQPLPLTDLQRILENLMFDGRYEHTNERGLRWRYQCNDLGQIYITQPPLKLKPETQYSGKYMELIDGKAKAFVILLRDTPDLGDDISTLFVNLCRKWLSDSQAPTSPSILTRELEMESSKESQKRFLEGMVTKHMMDLVPERLVTDSRQLLELITQVLSDFGHGGTSGNEEIAGIALSLLNMFITSPNFKGATELNSLLTPLNYIGRSEMECADTARNLSLLIQFQRTVGLSDSTIPAPLDRHAEDRKSYSLALSYITATDSPPPVRAQGLEIISSLVKAKSPILDIPRLLVLFTSLLQDGDEFIYLRVFKSFTELSHDHPRTVLRDLLQKYVDQDEDSDLDQRLRFGEALINVIQAAGTTFSGDTAQYVCEGLLYIASRRGQRPKTEKEQTKRKRLQKQKQKEAEEAWDGEVPDFEDALPEDNETIANIVSGWEGKRGTEDVRIRASALSIFGSGLEVSIAGIGTTLVSAAVDVSIHTLKLEPEPEKGILRRSAIVLILSFLNALDAARADGRKLGFGLAGQGLDDVQRTLSYIAATDNDGLVKENAGEVVERLEHWKLQSMLPVDNEQAGLQNLSGWAVKGLGGHVPWTGDRPRIEEIE